MRKFMGRRNATAYASGRSEEDEEKKRREDKGSI